ncbi:MAG: carbamoyltransferase HypF [Candidatus Cloacimonetes bacterium]|nr:carbamoyltransferase HypF [Candidatus Cloacimonadota bacterium]
MIRITVRGVVQGVGFRPFVYRLASELGLCGCVRNSRAGVQIDLAGDAGKREAFLQRLRHELPPAARIDELDITRFEDDPPQGFIIEPSADSAGATLVSPDLATCQDCLRELGDPSDARHDYAFINCTNCGPRYSIIDSLPYDRAATTMRGFALCPDCAAQYADPLDRRFHAQPVACPVCGPRLELLDADLQPVQGDPLDLAAQALRRGRIVAVKGLGGFHLACDAANADAVNELRRRKNRPHKPLAVMCLPERLEALVCASDRERGLLASPAAPVCILPKSEPFPLAAGVVPHNTSLGVMLPSTPLHWLLLRRCGLDLVMTSGNHGGEPPAIEPDELTPLADLYLTHNRPIAHRIDDSVLLPSAAGDMLVRRARGWAPLPLPLPFDVASTLSFGAEMKLGFCLAEGNRAFVSPHLGDGATAGTLAFYRDTLATYRRWFGIEPELAACDLQPDFATTHLAEKTGLPLVRVQHHHAHAAAVMAEHGLLEPALAVVYDGAGLGDDGTMWGGEILLADYVGYKRLWHLETMPLPGGDAAVRHPARIAFAWLCACGENADFVPGLPGDTRAFLRRQLEGGYRVFSTSSMGRLFDAVAAMLGLFPAITFEAQSAIALENLAGHIDDTLPYPFTLAEGIMSVKPLLRAVAEDIRAGAQPALVAARFHATVAAFTCEALAQARQSTGVSHVVLCGGVMQNRLLLNMLHHRLTEMSFAVFVPRELPPGDGAIALGQAVIAGRTVTREGKTYVRGYSCATDHP